MPLAKRIGILLTGHTYKVVEEWLFDWLLYGTVTIWATSVWGVVGGSFVAFAIMTPASAMVCEVKLAIYDAGKVDWWGIELLKRNRDEDAQPLRAEGLLGILFWVVNVFSAMIRTFQRWILSWGYIPALVLLSIDEDPFYTVVYLRKGAERYDGLDRRGWITFYTSVLVSNGYWTFRWGAVVAIAIYIFNHLPPPTQDALLSLWQQALELWSQIATLVTNLLP